MKMIIAVIFLGMLMHAFAEKCTLMPPATNFDSAKYYKITHMYVTHARSGQKTDVCQDYSTIKTSDVSTVTSVLENYKIGEKSHRDEFQCSNTDISGSQGQFSSVCKLPGGSGSNKNINYQSSIIATDNEKYTIIQRCPETGSDNILVLQTNKDVLEKGVRDYFDKVGWNIGTWISRTKVNCDAIKN